MDDRAASEVARAVVAALGPEASAALVRVKILVRARPTPPDLARGVHASQRGYFFGFAPEPATGTEIPDDTIAEGELVIFAGVHTSALEVERTLLHEIAHVLGHSEEEICEEMGLAP
ncbi:MAG TPA: hypothetical protein VE074_13935 [Jatrophihabitantaceae bacterium]|nr:hypothetical protein [Jatrophihabitantaceae bacterium]